MKKFFAFMFAALLMLSSTSSAETIQATGVGYGPKGANPKSSFYKTYARQAARLDAMAGLISIMKGVTVTIEELITKKPIRSYVSYISSDISKRAHLVGEIKFDENGVCEVTMEMDI